MSPILCSTPGVVQQGPTTREERRQDRMRSIDSKAESIATYKDTQHDPVSSVMPEGDVPIADHAMDSDEKVIMALGYKQEFKREFSLFTTFCVSFAVLGLLPSFASTMSYGVCPLFISSGNFLLRPLLLLLLLLLPLFSSCPALQDRVHHG